VTPSKDVVASILARLGNEARRQGVPVNQLLQFYAIERFLARLSHTPHVNGVLLKGALLLKTIDIPRARPTMDIDLLRQGKADRESLIAIVRDSAMVEDESDGVTFDAESIVAEDIAKDAEYLGTRLRFSGRMRNVRLHLQIDFGVGDAVVPGPRFIEYPTLLGQPSVRLRAVPIESSIAEKFHAMVELDAANSRMKDFYDLWTFSRHLSFDGATLAQAIAATFERRATTVPGDAPTCLTAAYFEAPDHVQQWRAFTRRIGEPALAENFAQLAGEIAAFVVPPAAAAGCGGAFASGWEPGGPWRPRPT
jgi:Nucleotidyl transferase AbiEii toxin, Type IV TA system